MSIKTGSETSTYLQALSKRVLVYDMFEKGFRFSKMGLACSEAIVLFVIVLVLSFIQFRWLKDRTA